VTGRLRDWVGETCQGLENLAESVKGRKVKVEVKNEDARGIEHGAKRRIEV